MTNNIEEFSWQYLKKEPLDNKAFLHQILEIFQSKKVVSVGEHHDENIDQSFDWILQFESEILDAYYTYRRLRDDKEFAQQGDLFKRCLHHNSVLLETLASYVPRLEEMKNMHVGRLFAFALLPLAKAAGYSDLVLEGLDSNDPARILSRSKDKIGDLLRLLMGMALDFKITGVVEDGLFTTPVDIGQGLFNAVSSIKDADPAAKVLLYNGAMHNATQPFQGEVTLPWGAQYDAREISYAPQARERWGDEYQSIDLLSRKRLLPPSHYRQMQEEAGDETTCYTHGINQKTFVI